jgi:hypothetical protein
MNPIAPYDALFTAIPILLMVAATLGIVLLIWVIYTIVWMAVRRGLEEYYGPAEYRGFTPPAARETDESAPAVRDRRHRSGRLTR